MILRYFTFLLLKLKFCFEIQKKIFVNNNNKISMFDNYFPLWGSEGRRGGEATDHFS